MEKTNEYFLSPELRRHLDNMCVELRSDFIEYRKHRHNDPVIKELSENSMDNLETALGRRLNTEELLHLAIGAITYAKNLWEDAVDIPENIQTSDEFVRWVKEYSS